MSWAHWDDENDRLLAVVNELPEAISALPLEQRIALGYREMYVERPEDYIERFHELSGEPKLEVTRDGRVRQHFPEADFSVAKVRAKMIFDVKKEASKVLQGTDWHFIRQLETGKEVPQIVLTLRQRQRDHVEWLERKIMKLDERELIDYRWFWPTTIDTVMDEEGTPIRYTTPPPDVPPAPPEQVGDYTPREPLVGPDSPTNHPDMRGVTPLVQPGGELDDPPPTTDAPWVHLDLTTPDVVIERVVNNLPRKVRE